MKTLCVIPARFASSRFPGKLLEPCRGRFVISWPIRAALKAFGFVVVATDDTTIAGLAASAGASVVMVTEECLNGTERVAWALRKLNVRSGTLIIGLQGDETEISADDLLTVQGALWLNRFNTPAIVSATCRQTERPCPHDVIWKGLGFYRGSDPNIDAIWRSPGPVAHHVGIYGYTAEQAENYLAYREIIGQQVDEAEQSMEQLRWRRLNLPFHMVHLTGTRKSINCKEDIGPPEQEPCRLCKEKGTIQKEDSLDGPNLSFRETVVCPRCNGTGKQHVLPTA